MPSLVYKTPLLVPIPTTFDEYLKRATKKCRYEQKNATAIDYHEVEFDKDEVAYWMELWEKQPIKGGFPRWRKYTPDKFAALYEQKILHVFSCGRGLQMVEKYDEYIYAHPPLYEKTDPIAKSMWFGLIEWCCGKIEWLDLGGGAQKRWNQLERLGYKWLYVPKDIELMPWKVQVCECGWRQLVEGNSRCRSCRR